MIYYSFDFPYQIIKSTRTYRCENQDCFNIIKERDIYWNVPTQLVVNKNLVWQCLCAKCVQVYFKELIRNLASKALDVRNDLGKAEMLAEEDRSDF